MLNPTYLSLEEATRKYGVEKKVLTQLIEAGMIETRETPTGELLVVADKNGNSQDFQTKEEIIAAKFAHLRRRPISASEASRRYSDIHGVPISHVLFSRWVRAGYITVMKRGYRLHMDEAEAAYCAEIFAQKYQAYGGCMSGVRIFDEAGNPYQLKYPEVAEQLRLERRLARQTVDTTIPT
jgi:hypothetical protein